MAYLDDELRRKADLIEQTPGTAGNGTARGLRAGVNPIQVAQAGDARAERFLQDAGRGTNSVGAPSVLNSNSNEPKPANIIDETIMKALGSQSPIDRRGNMPTDRRSGLGGSIQVAQAPGELLPPSAEDLAKEQAFRQKYGIKDAPASPAGATPNKPAPEADPLNLKKNLEKRLKDSGAELAGGTALAAGAAGVKKDAFDKAVKRSTKFAKGAVSGAKETLSSAVERLRGTSARDVGRGLGKGVNVAEQAASDVAQGAREARAGFREARSGGANPYKKPLTGLERQAQEARAFQQNVAPSGPSAPSGPRPGLARRAVGATGRAIGRGLGYATAGLAAGGAIKTAAEQTSDIAAGKRAATSDPANRLQRLREIGGGALRAVGLNFDRYNAPETPQGQQLQEESQVGVRQLAPLPASGQVGNAPLPPSGEGFFQRTTPGNEGPVTRVGGQPGQFEEEYARQVATRPGVRSNDVNIPIGPGAFGSMAALGAYGAASRLAKNESDAGTTASRLGLASRALDIQSRGQVSAARERQRQSNIDQVKNFASRGIDKRLTGPERAAATEQRQAEVLSLMERGAAERGIEVGQMGSTEIAQITDAVEFRDAIQADNRGLGAWFANLFGKQEFDSADPYSFIPTAYDPKSGRVEFGNGNYANIEDIRGGKGLFTTNKIQKHLDNLIKMAEKKGK